LLEILIFNKILFKELNFFVKKKQAGFNKTSETIQKKYHVLRYSPNL